MTQSIKPTRVKIMTYEQLQNMHDELIRLVDVGELSNLDYYLGRQPFPKTLKTSKYTISELLDASEQYKKINQLCLGV
jgi:hypothetical protein